MPAKNIQMNQEYSSRNYGQCIMRTDAADVGGMSRALTRVYGHFGTKTLRHQALVPKCPSDISAPVPLRHRSVSDISAPITEVVMLVNGGSYVVDGE